MGFVREMLYLNNNIVNSLFLKAAGALSGTNYTKIKEARSLVLCETLIGCILDL